MWHLVLTVNGWKSLLLLGFPRVHHIRHPSLGTGAKVGERSPWPDRCWKAVEFYPCGDKFPLWWSRSQVLVCKCIMIGCKRNLTQLACDWRLPRAQPFGTRQAESPLRPNPDESDCLPCPVLRTRVDEASQFGLY